MLLRRVGNWRSARRDERTSARGADLAGADHDRWDEVSKILLRSAGGCRVPRAALRLPRLRPRPLVGVVRSGGDAPLDPWAPLVDSGDEGREPARVIAAYGVLNASKALRASWGVDDEHSAAARLLVQGGASNCSVLLVPDHVLDDILVPGPRPEGAGRPRPVDRRDRHGRPRFSRSTQLLDRVRLGEVGPRRPLTLGLRRGVSQSRRCGFTKRTGPPGSVRHRNT